MRRSISCSWLISLALLPTATVGAQSYLKVNVASALVGIPGVGVERTIGDRWTFQVDATASPWRSVNGVPLQFLIVIPEWRFHPQGVARGWYVGAHAGASAFRLQKWDYWGTTRYEKGYSLFLGATFGYQRPLSDRWLVDAFVGGGSSQAIYKGYDWTTGARYDGAAAWNKSGEWLPYRGGVMLSRRLGR